MNINHKNKTNSKFILIAISVAIFAFTFSIQLVQPKQALAFEAVQIIDPFCLWSGCDEDDPSTVNNTYTNSNNVNSNINSPGAVVNNSGNSGSSYDDDYDYDYDYGYNDDYGRLGVSCYGTPRNPEEGERVTWYANAYGGSGSYRYEWDGTDGLDGSGRSITKRYNNDGVKRAEVRVTSGGRTVTEECDEVYVDEDDNYDDDYDNDYDYDYDQLAVSCRPGVTFATTGQTVEWIAYATGGTGRYNYRWDGSDDLNGTSRIVNKRYNRSGTKSAEVRVTSGNRTVTHQCSPDLIVGLQTGYPSNINSGGIQVACFADSNSARIGTPVTWIAEAAGGTGSYTYTWSGSDGLSGTASRVATSYFSAGYKTASITVYSGGLTNTVSCGNTVSVTTGTQVKTEPVDTDKDDDNALSAASIFSLNNVPWGWVAILVILVLFAMVMYLLFNKSKV
jgi:hypothetical protein